MLDVSVSRVLLYPIKSLGSLEVVRATIGPGGGLAGDRTWRIVRSASGEVVNGKKERLLHYIDTRYTLGERGLGLEISDRRTQRVTRCSLPDGAEPLAHWLSDVLGYPVRLEHAADGFPDDTEARGPTIVSVATLHRVASQFGLSAEEVRRRFRANLEIDGPEMPAFWEDTLFGPAGTQVPFSLGAVTFEGVNPCQRCAVPARNSLTGEDTPGFAKAFGAFRSAELPSWAARDRFNHFYRLTVNTNVSAAAVGASFGVGDRLRL